jgi:DNA-binding HxlR family transcriptional regulator
MSNLHCNLRTASDYTPSIARHNALVTIAPLDRALARVGDRWTLLLVEALLDGPRRYGELSDAVPGIAPNILAARLKRLEQDGLVTASPYSERPVRHQYTLTADGRELAAALVVLAAWAARVEGLPAPRYHATCGTALESRPWCPTCGRTVDAQESDELDRL